MPIIDLKSDQSARICFILVAGNESIHNGPTKRDCILTCPQQKVEDADHPLSLARTEHLHVEHKAMISENYMTIQIENSGNLELNFTSHDIGTWQFIQQDKTAHGKFHAPNNGLQKNGSP